MRRIPAGLAVGALVLGLATTANATRWKVDGAHTTVSFSVSHLFTSVRGRFDRFEGSVEFDPAKPEATVVRGTIEAAIVERSSGYDEVLQIDNARRTAGFKIMGPENGEFFGPKAFGHTGLGGSAGWADLDRGVSFGYAMNYGWPGPRGSDPRMTDLSEAVYQCL